MSEPNQPVQRADEAPAEQHPAAERPSATAAAALSQLTERAREVGSKYLAVRHLSPGERTDLLGSLFGLRLTRNPGAAFSMATNSPQIFTIISILVAITILWMVKRLRSYGWALALGLLLGGALGNLSDRLFREPGFGGGHVVDFLEFPHWPIFNIADSCVVTAALLIGLFSILGLGIDGRRASSPPPGDV